MLAHLKKTKGLPQAKTGKSLLNYATTLGKFHWGSLEIRPISGVTYELGRNSAAIIILLFTHIPVKAFCLVVNHRASDAKPYTLGTLDWTTVFIRSML